MKNATKTARKKLAAEKADDRADDQRKETAEAGNAGGAADPGDHGGKPIQNPEPPPGSGAGAAVKTSSTEPPADKTSSVEPQGKKSKDNPEAKTAEGGAGDPAGPAATDGLIAITVIGPARGMRRCGHQFDATPKVVRVTTGELKTIEADPALAVTRGAVVDDPGPEGALPSSRDVADFLDMQGKPIAIKVLGPAKGRRRGGHQFGREAVTITPASRDELAQILGDADLSVARAA
ncbi:MAG: hypothetical protein KF810_02885 [Rhizobiaceae bacterium]|nr:hypothetical protein [Rhizobiaceae bacterium]